MVYKTSRDILYSFCHGTCKIEFPDQGVAVVHLDSFFPLDELHPVAGQCLADVPENRKPGDGGPFPSYSATPSLTCEHTMRAVPLSLKISPLKRNTFPAAIALEFSICVLLST